MQRMSTLSYWVGPMAGALLLIAAPCAWAVPSFARQTGMACEACHTVYPELTHFGRVFKANGYVLDNLKQVQAVSSTKEQLLELAQTPPLSIMVQASYTQLARSLPDNSGSIPGVAQNGTVSFPQQVGIFYAGKVAPHFGAFLQVTYSNQSGTISIDNTDLRYANIQVLPSDQSLIYGVSLNNNPTMQDLWNSTPAFGFPFASSNAVVPPLARTQIDGTLAQSVAGISAYAFWNESLYAEFGAYRSAKQGATNQLTGEAGPLDGTSSNVISGLAPYWRVAYEHDWGPHSIEVGVYGLDVKLLPGGTAAQPAPLVGPYNRFRDIAQDLQYQLIADEHIVSFAATRIHESMSLNASFASGASSNATDDLTTSRLALTYYYRRKIGGTLSYFSTTGSADPALYPGPAIPPATGPIDVITSANGKPDTRGWIAEVNYLPWLNTKLGAQYTAYSKFNGGGSDYDGAGRNAADNNAWYLLLWFAY
jgi:hypothetical protein